jgi:hypothetical protein
LSALINNPDWYPWLEILLLFIVAILLAVMRFLFLEWRRTIKFKKSMEESKRITEESRIMSQLKFGGQMDPTIDNQIEEMIKEFKKDRKK